LGAANEMNELGALPVRFQAGDVIAAKYQVQRIIGAGGMGVVLQATHLQLGQSVAIKLLNVDEATRAEATVRFLREGRAAASLKGDHVVRIYDVGTLDDGLPFIVMEFLHGVDLAELLEIQGPLSVEQAVEYITQATSAIAEAHDNGIVHRDLKPSNLFATQQSDGSNSIKVLDFGISKSMATDTQLQGNLTATRSVLGSPFYMSPEQVRDAKKVDTRTDIWSLGVILQELLTGEPVFNAETLTGICAAIAADAPTPLRERRPDAPPELERVILRCLEKDPGRRFQNARDLLAALASLRGRSGFPVGVPLPLRDTPPPTRAHSAIYSAPTLATAAAQAEPGPAPSDSHKIPSTKEPQDPGSERTVLSAGGSAKAGVPAPSPPQAKSRLYFWGMLGLVASALAVWRFGASTTLPAGMPAPARASATVPKPAGQPASFSLFVDSDPPSADVYEGALKLGQTPLKLTIENQTLTTTPRTFTLRRAGFQPYSLVQRNSAEDVRVLAMLGPEATKIVPESTHSRPRITRPHASSKPSVRTENAATDIRMER